MAIVIIVVAALSLLLVPLFGPKPVLSAELTYYTSNQFAPGLGWITVTGTISNSGDEPHSGTVNLRIYDGYSWHNFREPTGIVPAGGSVGFYWNDIFDRMDADECIVRYSIVSL